jgi:RHS repeat-associated protein
MDGKADSAMEVEVFESAEGEVLLPGREEARAAEVNATSVVWGGRPAFASGSTFPGPNAREVSLEEAEGRAQPRRSFENGGRSFCRGSGERMDEVEPNPDEGSPADADPDTFEELATSAPAAFSNAVVRYYVTDHLGSPRVVLDAQRQVLDRHDYEPFGVELTPFTDQADLTHRFTGHERDLQTGYDYMHFRFYGSNMGRFLKPDSVVANAADPQSWNLYAYVRNNPILLNDPSGHMVGIAYRSYTWAGGDIAGSMGIHQEANAVGGGIGLGEHPLDAGFGPTYDSWFGLAALISSRRNDMVRVTFNLGAGSMDNNSSLGSNFYGTDLTLVFQYPTTEAAALGAMLFSEARDYTNAQVFWAIASVALNRVVSGRNYGAGTGAPLVSQNYAKNQFQGVGNAN